MPAKAPKAKATTGRKKIVAKPSTSARRGAAAEPETEAISPMQAERPADVATEAPASPFVEDGGIIGLPDFALVGPPSPADPETPDMAMDAGAETPTETSEAPAAPTAPAEDTAPEMKLPRSFEDLAMDDLEGEGPTEEQPAGNLGQSTSDSIAGSTADMLLSTVQMLSNQFITDLSSINEQEIEDAVADDELPAEVLKDVQRLNKLNEKDKPFKAEYRDMIKPHLKRFCAVQGVENLSPTTMLIVVVCIVATMMFMDARKRIADRNRFLKRLMSKYAKPADVVESKVNRQ